MVLLSIIDRYIARSVLMATGIVVGVIVGLDAIFAVVDQLDKIRNNYGIWEILQFTLARIPRRAYEYMPLACLVGCLAGLGGLAASSELSVIRAAGISVWRICIAVIKPMIVIMLLSMMVAEYVVPPLERYAQSFRAVALGKGETFSNRGKGYWHREGNQFMRFSAIEPNGVLHGITFYRFDGEANLIQTTYVKRALYQRGYWQMEDIRELNIDDTATSETLYSSKRWDTELTPSALNVVMVEPRDMSISTLHNYTEYLDKQGLDSGIYALSFWRKMLQPLNTFALVLLGISFIFGPMRAVTPGSRIFGGIMVGLIYKYVEEMCGPLMLIAGLSPVFASLIPIVGCSAAAIYLLRRAG